MTLLDVQPDQEFDGVGDFEDAPDAVAAVHGAGGDGIAPNSSSSRTEMRDATPRFRTTSGRCNRRRSDRSMGPADEESATVAPALPTAGRISARLFEDAAGLDMLETHISRVVFVDELVYKRKKAVHFAFIDLRSFEQRAGSALGRWS